MLRLLLIFLIPAVSVQAVELLRDRHGSEEFVSKPTKTEMAATVDADGATIRATDWAVHFYATLSVSKTENFGTNLFDFG